VGDGELEDPVEDHSAAAGAAAVEPERELVQVRGQVSFHLRPRHTVTLEPVAIAVQGSGPLVVEWSLTATNCSGNPTGSLTVPISTGITADDLRNVIKKRT
jgi:hypothetical protein